MVYWLVKIVAKREVGERGWEMVYRFIEAIDKGKSL